MSKHNLANVQLTVGFALIAGGFGPTDAITFTNDAPISTVTRGIEGEVVPSFSRIKSLTCRISLLPTSVAYTALVAELDAQALAASLGPLPPLPFLMVDANNGTTVSALNTIFLDAPTPSRGKAVAPETFTLSLSVVTKILGPLNVPQ